jgi:hypothetical protein
VKRPARWTNLAAARACMPNWFTTVTERDVILLGSALFSPEKV